VQYIVWLRFRINFILKHVQTASLIPRHLKFLVFIFNYVSIKYYQYWFNTVRVRTFVCVCFESHGSNF